MKNGAKRLLSLLLALVMACSLAVMPAAAEDGEEDDSAGDTPLRSVELNGSGVYEYGTPLTEIIKLPSPYSPDTSYTFYIGQESYSASDSLSARTYEGATIRIGSNIDFSVPTFTITPATLTLDAFDAQSAAYIKNGYWKEIFADDPNNNDPAINTEGDNLTSCLQGSDGNSLKYTATYGNGKKVEFTVNWSMDNSLAFNPKGYEANKWYTFTAHFISANGNNGSVDINNFDLTKSVPKGYVRVYPVTAVQTLDPDRVNMTKTAVTGLVTETNQNDNFTLNDPAGVGVTYLKIKPQAAAAADMLDELSDTEKAYQQALEFSKAYPALSVIHTVPDVISTFSISAEAYNAVYKIAKWKIEENDITFGDIKTEAEKVTATKPVTVTLTPDYLKEGAEGYAPVPAWATLAEHPKLTLVITENAVPDVEVIAPSALPNPDSEGSDIIYGNKYGNPAVKVGEGDATPVNNSTVTINDNTYAITYVGVNGTKYGPSATKPSDAGQYRVVATLAGGGSWSSDVFTIKKRQIDGFLYKDGTPFDDNEYAATPIICKDKVYDGTTDATLDTSKATLDGLIDEDKDKVKFTVSGYFAFDLDSSGNEKDGTGQDVGNKRVVISELILSGAAAGNYEIPELFNKDGNGKPTSGIFLTTGKITPKLLTIDDSGLSVTKAQNDAGWTVKGELKLEGVIGSEIILDVSGAGVQCSNYNVGANKTVTLTNITKIGTGKLINYSFAAGTGLEKGEGDNDFKYTFKRAEITENAIPKLGKDFTVTFPENPVYDGENSYAVTVAATEGTTGLGKSTVTYAKRNSDGSLDTATTTAPKNPGTYQVLVSFEKGDNFAAATGVNAIPVGLLTIKKAPVEAKTSIDVPANARTVFPLSELKYLDNENATLSSAIVKDVKLKGDQLIGNTAQGSLDDDDGEGNTLGDIDAVWAFDGQNFFEVVTQALAEGKEKGTGSFTLIIASDYYEITVTVTVTIKKDLLSITPEVEYLPLSYGGKTALKDILRLVYSEDVEGSYDLKNPDKVYDPGTYTDELIAVVFTDSEGSTHDIFVLASFTIWESAAEDYSAASDLYFTIYANNKFNESVTKLSEYVMAQKSVHKDGANVYDVDSWNSDGKTTFNPRGYSSNTWYNFTATLNGNPSGVTRPKAHVRVIPVNAVPTLATSSKTVSSNDLNQITSVEDLALPTEVKVSYSPALTPEYPSETFTQYSGMWKITGWQINGSAFTTISQLGSAGEVTLTPVCEGPAWATVTGTPTFKLVITGKNLVNVTWNGPDSVEYSGTKYSLDPSKAPSHDGDDIGTFDWTYTYYDSNKRQLSEEPTNAGTYYVNAVLENDEFAGESGLMKFTINRKPINELTFTPPEGMSLTYDGTAHTPEYTVTVGETVLVKDTDYTVAYSNNINATDEGSHATVTFTGKGNYGGTKSVTFDIQPLALTTAQIPTITGATGADGAAKAGDVLSASLEGVDSSELSWTWKVDGSTVEDHTAPSYEVQPEDSNKTITVSATGNDNYSGTSGTSEGTNVSKYTVTGTVSIAVDDTNTDTLGDGGKIVVGTVLTAAANVTPDATKNDGTWKWTVDGVEVTEGVVNNTYTVAASDDGKKIVAVFTFGDDADYKGTIESAEIEVGEALLTGTVAIDSSNGTVVGCKLTARVTGGPDGQTYTYAWLRDGNPISGASGAEYTIVAADRGKTISVSVTADGCTGELSDSIPIPTAAPGKPTVTVTPGNGTLTINWSAPSDNGGAPITGYKLAIKQGNTSILAEITLAASVTRYTQSNLTNGTQYTVIVKAVNSEGDGEAATVTGIPSSGGGGGGGGGGGASTPVTPVNPTPGEDEDTDEYLITNLTGEDGSDIIIVQNLSNGSVGSTTTDPSGKTIILVDLPANVGESGISGEAVRLPIREAYANKDLTNAPTVTLNSMDVNGIKVRIPIVNNSINVVAVRVNPNGSEELIKNTLPTKDGIMLRMDCWNIIKLYDNSKYFTDTQDHWAADAVSFASSRELFNGTGDGTFSPDAAMTRGMLVTVLARYKDVDTSGGATWYDKGAAWAVANGLSDGTDLGGNITREQLATIMYRFAQFEGKLSGTGASLAGYTDAGSVSSWAADAMSWAVSVGLINGITPTTLDPQGSATRAQVATILMRYMQMFAL